MCKLKKYHKTSNTQVDKCIKMFITNLGIALDNNYEVVACCCGHGKYRMSVIVKREFRWSTEFYDLISGETIPRKRNFYKKDKQGYYFIPEVLTSTTERKKRS